MLQEADHWRKQSALAIKAFSEAQKSTAGEAAIYDNCVQVNLDINSRLITANFNDNRGNSFGWFVNFWEMCSFTGPMCIYIYVLLPRAHFIKDHFICHSRLLLCHHSSTFIKFMSKKFRTLSSSVVIQKHLEWRLRNREHLVGALPQDWFNGLVELLCQWMVLKKSTIETSNYHTENVSGKLFSLMQAVSMV